MPETKDDLHEHLISWRKIADEAKAGAARHKQPASHEDEAFLLQLSKLAIWLAGIGSCLVLAWWLSGGSFLLTGITLLFPLGAWFLFGWYRWALLLPLSLMGLLALNGASQLW
jgi:hypothetical protein